MNERRGVAAGDGGGRRAVEELTKLPLLSLISARVDMIRRTEAEPRRETGVRAVGFCRGSPPGYGREGGLCLLR